MMKGRADRWQIGKATSLFRSHSYGGRLLDISAIGTYVAVTESPSTFTVR
jgi:hypothetical protein